MATRGRTADPTLVTNIDTWLRFYKDNYRNVVHRNGAMLVLDPANLEGEPVKTITPPKGHDYVTILSSGKERRDAAEAKRNAVELEIADGASESRKLMLEVEQQLLSAMDTWRSAETVAARTIAAVEVGRITKEMDHAENMYRTAMYPHRFTKIDEEIPNKLIDWATRDDRKRGLLLLVNERTVPSDRSVIEADRA